MEVKLIEEADDALLGLTMGEPGQEPRAVYDYEKLVGVYARQDGWDETDAREWIAFNVIGHGVVVLVDPMDRPELDAYVEGWS